MGSIFALGALGLTACGDDSSSNANEGGSSSSAEPLILSSVSETSPLDEGSKLEVRVDGPDKDGNYQLSLSGIIKTNNDDFDTEGYEGDDRVYYNIDNIQFDVGDKNGNRVNLPVPVNPAVFNNNADRGINLITAINGDINLDQDVIGCGEFTLYATIFMSGDEEDTKKFAYTARLDASFNLQCKEIESSSSGPEVCTEMEKVGPITLSNQGALDQNAINFATGAKDSPDVTLTFEEGAPFFTASAGVDIIPEDAQETGVIPEGKVCQEQFHESHLGVNNHMELDGMLTKAPRNL